MYPPTVEGKPIIDQIGQQSRSLAESGVAMSRVCERWMAPSSLKGALDANGLKKTPTLEKEQIQAAIANYAECMGWAQNYIRETDGLLKRHTNLLEAKESEKKQGDAVNAVMATVAIVLAVITMWLGWGATAIDKVKQDALDSAKNVRQLALQIVALESMRIAAELELFKLIERFNGVRAAASNLAVLSMYTRMLQVDDATILRDAQANLGNWWMPPTGDTFPKAAFYLAECRGRLSPANHKYVSFFD